MLMILSVLIRDLRDCISPREDLERTLYPGGLVDVSLVLLLHPVPGPSRRFHSHLRVKVDGGEGTLPVAALRANQKCEGGVATANQTACMSCTDKLAK